MSKSTLLLLLLIVTAINLLAQDTQNTPSGKISGMVYADYFYNIEQRNGNLKDLNGFQFRRIHFTYDYNISEEFMSRFRLEADQAANTSNGKIGVFVKDAYLRWRNIFEGSNLTVGISPNPAFEVAEEFWGYRSLEKTILDFRGIVSSRDFGIDLRGKFDKAGMTKYWFKVGNNSGNSPEVDKYKRYYGHVHFSPSANFQVTLYSDFDTRAKKLDIDRLTKSNNRITLGGFAGYSQENSYSVGIEGFYHLAQNNVRSASTLLLDDQKLIGVTTFAWLSVAPKIRLVGRYDVFDPNTNVAKDAIFFILAGLDYSAAKNVHFIPNIHVQTYQDGGNSDIVGRITLFFTY